MPVSDMPVILKSIPPLFKGRVGGDNFLSTIVILSAAKDLSEETGYHSASRIRKALADQHDHMDSFRSDFILCVSRDPSVAFLPKDDGRKLNSPSSTYFIQRIIQKQNLFSTTQPTGGVPCCMA